MIWWTKWRDKRRELEMRRAFYAQFIACDDLCFDVGANCGNRTEVFLSLGARVVAVEPQEQCQVKLRRRFGGDPRVTLVPEALGAAAGEAEIYLSGASTVSSMSPAWIEKVKASGRFAGVEWKETTKTGVTTLDALIKRHGRPVFCKVDVEGFEAEILRGLSSPIQTVSFEFVPEIIETALACVARLDRLGCREFNFSYEESMRLERPEWTDAASMKQILTGLPDPSRFGDVYARVPETSH